MNAATPRAQSRCTQDGVRSYSRTSRRRGKATRRSGVYRKPHDDFSSLYLVFGALITICVAVPESATAVNGSLAYYRPANAISTAPPYRGVHVVPRDAHNVVALPTPAGCSSTGSLSFTGGGTANTAGGFAAGIIAGGENKACDNYTTVGDGEKNVVGGDSGSYNAGIFTGISNGIELSAGAVIGGGENNLISDLPPYGNSNLSAIASGFGNVIGSPDSFIGSGQANTIVPPSLKLPHGMSPSAFIGAGFRNAITSDYAVVAGGFENSVTGEFATIGGGHNNSAGGLTATVAGGYENVASGQNAEIPGGAYNVAGGRNSFAAGNRSLAANDGSFVWSDFSTSATTLSSNASNQFLARSAGGFFLFSSANLSTGVMLAPGSGSWSNVSDRNVKTDISQVDPESILARVATLPVTEWSYRAEDRRVRHVGPMAQDFYSAFGVGEDNRHITTIDEDGVALAAIKALNAKNSALEAELQRLAARDAKLEATVAALLARAN